jgi:hypothetical protein
VPLEEEPVFQVGDKFLGGAPIIGKIGRLAPCGGNEGAMVKIIIPQRVQSIAIGIVGGNEAHILRFIFATYI